ncbi:hypothetical protein FFLO_01304 [Filobasidium floriforme]|uniref:Acyl-CoA desaturase n=1 Tax=Filobasidium floriforme TaxID=5210 RepID=A0A8K0JQ75_9TREE|nr:hypothetical protein FFLO_01304 [Filobasidium floriforme]
MVESIPSRPQGHGQSQASSQQHPPRHTHVPTHSHSHSHSHHHHHHHHHSSSTPIAIPPSPIWWSNTLFFLGFHVLAIYGVLYLAPPSKIGWQTWVLCGLSWQAASFGVTIGYHRLWSHKAFTATLPLRITLAWMASLGFQGSVKWWVLRHRLHHRFTDDPIHDPYSATRGLWFAHCGWIFRRPNYPRMKLIEKDDLEADPVVRFQHKYFVPIAVFSGLVLPTLVAKYGWGDAMGGYVWGGLVARLLIWHTTFCINSLAHWTGLQPYTEEVTARGNYLLALLTSGEGNHNFHHLFPADFRNGPHPQDWDPTKWIIWALHTYTPLVPTIRRTKEAEINKAKAHVHRIQAERLTALVPEVEKSKEDHELPEWTVEETLAQVASGQALLLIDGYIVDVSDYLDEHVSSTPMPMDTASRSLKRRSARTPSSPSSIDSGYESLGTSSGNSSPTGERSADESTQPPPQSVVVQTRILKDASRAFFGQINNHSQAAKEKMRCLRVARLSTPDRQDEDDD